MSRNPSNNPISSANPSSLLSAIPTDYPTNDNCEQSGRQILKLNGAMRKCNYIARNANKLCIRGVKYCANQSGNLVRDYSNVCCGSCNVYYNDTSCFTITSAPTINGTIEVKLNVEIEFNENGIKLKKYNPSTGSFSITKYAKGRKACNEANKTYNFDVVP